MPHWTIEEAKKYLHNSSGTYQEVGRLGMYLVLQTATSDYMISSKVDAERLSKKRHEHGSPKNVAYSM